MSKIFILLQNIRSIRKNFDEFNLLIVGFAIKPSAICLTEIWLADDGDTDCYQLPGYQKMITCNRKTKGGVVSIFVKNNIRWYLNSKFSNRHCQALTFRFMLNDINVSVTTIYVKTNTSINNFSENIQVYLDNIQLRPKERRFLCGDLNIDHSKPNNKEKAPKMDLRRLTCSFASNWTTPEKLQSV